MYVFYLLIIACIIVTTQGYFWIEEGGKCSKRSGERGICTHFNDCASAIREVRRNGRPEICSFAHIYPIVCCNDTLSNDGQSQISDPTPKNASNFSYYNIPFNENSISLKKCREYHPRNTKEIPLYEEKDSEIKRHPHIALLGFPNDNKVEWVCAGSLISEQFVLTSAHCLISRRFGKIKYVRLGELEIDSAKDDSQLQDFTIENSYAHPDFRTPYRYYDIALVQLNKPAKFTDYVKPVCLAVTENLDGTLPEATGWGLYRERSSILGTNYLKYVANEDCKKTYPPKRFLEQSIISSQICAIDGSEEKAPCYGDQGGPLQITNFFYEFNNFPEIVGIVSFGKRCGLSTDVFTRVYPYVPWIEKIVWPNL